jgi:hypothetical protein
MDSGGYTYALLEKKGRFSLDEDSEGQDMSFQPGTDGNFRARP